MANFKNSVQALYTPSFPFMNNRQTLQTRNKVVDLLDKCAIATKKKGIANSSATVLNLRRLATNLRQNASYVTTLSYLNSQYTNLFDILKTLKSQENISDSYKLLESITSNAINYMTKDQQDQAEASNTLEYYKNKVAELSDTIKELTNKLQKLDAEGKKETPEYKETQEEIAQLQVDLKDVNTKKEVREQREDKVKQVESMIEPFTTNLEASKSELQNERERLVTLYHWYGGALIAAVVILIGWETYLMITKWDNLSPKNWLSYLPFYLPLPLIGGLVWLFIAQMNRAQKQLVSLANRIQQLMYIDGLLQTSNRLSADRAKNEDHVSSIIDTIIRSYLSGNVDTGEEKDSNPLMSLPYDKWIELVKSFTGSK